MPFALETNPGGVGIGRSRFIPCVSICDQDFPEEEEYDSDCSDASSIGRNSASSEDDSDREDSGELELKKSPLDTMNDLEEDLPLKKGISKFYSGKSRSYTSLADAAAVTSVQEMVKPEDPYAKKRKNLLARNIARSRSCAFNLGGISKRSANIGGGKSCLNLSSSDCNEEGESSSRSISPPCPLPPLHPHPHANNKSSSANKSQPPPPWRSYSWSVSDLHSVVAEAREISGLAICSGNEGNKVH